MINLAVYWPWLVLVAVAFWLTAFVPTWMHGRATAADAYENGWFDRNERKPLRPYFAGWRALLGGRHSRLRLWAEWRWPRVYLPPGRELAPEREWAEITALLPPVKDQEWAGEYGEPCRECGSLLAYSHCDGCSLAPGEITADWMTPASRAELALWVQEMTLVKS